MIEGMELPKTYEDALRTGFRRLEDLDPKLRKAIATRDEAMGHHLDVVINRCGPGQTGPCSTTDYPGGIRKVCYCNAANQCDDNCVFQTPH